MTTVKDKETKTIYKLIGNMLFSAPLFSDGTVDEDRWERVVDHSTPYHRDIHCKLLSMNQISASMNKGIWDDLS
mgnify:FL=1|tara:strand:- start:298 stop:519 length:222 start_codon:yes stop_codon:yes gene_type:complete